MAQTEREWTTIETLLANNTNRQISPTDHRDVMASAMGGYAALILTAAGSPATIVGVDTSYTLVDVFDQITAQSSAANTSGASATLSPTYTLTVGVTGIYRLDFWSSVSFTTPNRLVTFRPHVNGSPGLVQFERYVSSSDTGSIAASTVLSFTAADVVDIRVKINSTSGDMSFSGAGLSISRVG